MNSTSRTQVKYPRPAPFFFGRVSKQTTATALALACTAALSAPEAGAQTVTVAPECPEEECHVVPLVRSGGGFVARALDPGRDVQAALACIGTSKSKHVVHDLTPSPEGLVSLLFGTGDWFCEAGTDGRLEVRGLDDGGWYWINDSDGSAISPLMAKDVLENRKVQPVNPGPGFQFETDTARTASYVKHLSSGRVGILPHVVPEPELDLAPCGPVLQEGEEEAYETLDTGCTMGDGGAVVDVHTYEVGGGRLSIRGGQLRRPGSGEGTVVGVSLWLNGTGSVVYGDSTQFPPEFGFRAADGTSLSVTEWQVEILDAGPTTTLADVDIESHLDMRRDNGDAHMVVSPSDTFCPAEGEQHAVRLRVRATGANDNQAMPLNPVRPRIRSSAELNGAIAETIFSVACPAPAATAAGQELAPGSRNVRKPAPGY